MTDSPSLNALAVRYRTDKSSQVHGYCRIYEPLLAPCQDQPLRLLEIGIGTGASLPMWRSYLPRAQLVALDLQDCRHLEPLGIRTYRGIQGDGPLLDRLASESGPFDFIVDDGSHRSDDQVLAFERLYPHLRPGGYYAIEDLHTCWRPEYQDGPRRTLTFLTGLVQDLNVNGRSGYGTLRNDPEAAALRPQLNLYEATLASIAFYPSLALVQKRLAEPSR